MNGGLRLHILLATLALQLSIHDVAGAGARFCVVPVKNGAPNTSDYGQIWRMVGEVFNIPGIRAPVFVPTNIPTKRQGAWTINDRYEFVPYDQPFPSSYLNNWIVEPWSGRIVAKGLGIFVLDPGAGRFTQVAGRWAGRPYVLPRQKLTIVIENGQPFIVGEVDISPWISKSELDANGITGVASVHDAPSLAATVFADTDRRLHVRTDEGKWYALGKMVKHDYGKIVDVPSARAAVFVAEKSVTLISQDRRYGPAPYWSQRLRTTSARGAWNLFAESRLFGQVLTFEVRNWFGRTNGLHRLGTHGFEAIPGGEQITMESRWRLFDHVLDLPTLGFALINAETGLYRYDGERISPIVGGERNRIGSYVQIYDLPTIGKVLLAGESKLFELNDRGVLRELSTPFRVKALDVTATDWPGSNVALLTTPSGIFTVNTALEFEAVEGGRLRSNFFVKPILMRSGEIVVATSKQLVIVADRQRTNVQVCSRADDVIQ